MIDIERQIKATERHVTRRRLDDGGEVVTLLLRRGYDSPAADVWEALTDPERLRRWFLPISGDLRVGGTFQLEGNAGGDILACDPPKSLKVTFGGPTSIVELRLIPDGDDATTFELEHTVPLEMAGSGAGALFVGPGWDGTVLGLDLHLRGEVIDDPVAWGNSAEGLEYSRQSIDAWVSTVEASGTATAEEIAAGKAAALAQFSPEA